MEARTVKFILVGLEDVNELWDMCLGIGLNENNFTKMTAGFRRFSIKHSYILLKVSF